jgi:hypothetical protein
MYMYCIYLIVQHYVVLLLCGTGSQPKRILSLGRKNKRFYVSCKIWETGSSSAAQRKTKKVVL